MTDVALGDPFDRPSLRSSVRRHLKWGIIRGRLPSGARLGEEALATQLKISRTPLREALIGLERDGFVVSLPGRGFRVRELLVSDVEQDYPIIDALEALALRTGPPIEDELLRRLEAINGQLAAAARLDHTDQRVEECVRLDRLWHSTLVARSPNQRLVTQLCRLYDHAARYEYAYWSSVGDDTYSTDEHEAVIAFLREGDADGAQSVLTGHWQKGGQLIVERIQRSSAGAPADGRFADTVATPRPAKKRAR